MKTKSRMLACVLAVMCCMAAFSMNAFASGGDCYASDESGEETPPDFIDSITVSTEGVKLPKNQGSEPLTPDGNLSLIDDIHQLESYKSSESELQYKQFITVQSKNGNNFYIIIDRSGDTENVYFLNLVDEADLMAVMKDGATGNTLVCTCSDKCVTGDVDGTCPICKSNMIECTGKEAATAAPEPDADTKTGTDTEPEKTSSNSNLILVVLVIAIAAGGALYWFKFRKAKTQTKGNSDLDDYEFDTDDDATDEEYENEDNPETSEGEDSEK